MTWIRVVLLLYCVTLALECAMSMDTYFILKFALEVNTFWNLTLAGKLNLWNYVEIVQHNTENGGSALSHFRPEVEIEHSSTQGTKCLLLTNLANTLWNAQGNTVLHVPGNLDRYKEWAVVNGRPPCAWSCEVRHIKSDAKRKGRCLSTCAGGPNLPYGIEGTCGATSFPFR
jgi:hypothetical protein